MSTSHTELSHTWGAEARRYALLGALFGVTFPIAGTLIQMLLDHAPLALAAFLQTQKSEPVLWIVDTAPLVLGIFASFAGRRQDNLLRLNEELNVRERELEHSQINLEQRVQERTHELQIANEQIEKRASRLQAIAEISQSIALTENPDELFPLITRAISERLGFYHTGIFLLDDTGDFAVLKGASSEGGQRMLAHGYKLKSGGVGIVGFVASTGRPRIALDTGSDSLYFDNPYLPATRSEIALPLHAGGQLIGVLDVQSEQSSAFNDEDIDTLNTLANQVAIVIQNARLFDQVRATLQTYVENGRRGWLEHIENRAPGYSYLPDGTLAVPTTERQKQFQKLIASEETVVLDTAKGSTPATLAIPVKLRDQVIGIIHIEARDANRKWSDDEIGMVQSISERAALALENARLFEETSRKAQRERVIADVTSRIGESNNIERILKTTITELGRTLGAARTFIQLETQSSSSDDVAPQV